MASPPRPVYSKSNPAGAAPVPARTRRLLIVICAAVAALVAGGGTWAGLAPDALTSSARGCISVSLPGSIGGEVVHACGSQAKAVCRAAYAGSDAASLAERPACERAGLTRASVGP